MPFDNPINEDDEKTIEDKTKELEMRIPIRSFVVPGMTGGSAALDLARTIARRAERRVVALSRIEDVSPVLMRTLNRLSDYIYMLAREEEAAQGKLTFV
jgi:ATP:cob(I)alamin adenosyltransferase